MKTFRVETIKSGKLTLVHSFKTLEEARNYSVAWSNDWGKSSFVRLPGGKNPKYFTHQNTSTGVYELRT